MLIEKGFCAMGHELDGDVSPLDVGLGFATRKSGGFTGFEALSLHKAAGATSRLVSLRFAEDAAVPIGHEPIVSAGRIIGQTTSCGYGHRVGAPVALALVETPLPDGAVVSVSIAGGETPASVCLGPLFDPEGARMKPAASVAAARVSPPGLVE